MQSSEKEIVKRARQDDVSRRRTVVADDSERRLMEKTLTAIAMVVLGAVIVAYGKELILSGKRMLGA